VRDDVFVPIDWEGMHKEKKQRREARSRSNLVSELDFGGLEEAALFEQVLLVLFAQERGVALGPLLQHPELVL